MKSIGELSQKILLQYIKNCSENDARTLTELKEGRNG